jgi:hypothetical protein
MGVEAAQVAIPGAEASTQPIQKAAITVMDSNAPPDGEKRAEEERQDIPESSKRKREVSEESHRTARSDSHQNSITDVSMAGHTDIFPKNEFCWTNACGLINQALSLFHKTISS